MPKSKSALWTTLIHQGVCFPAPYVRLPPSVKVLYNKSPMTLNEEQEEAACLFAKAEPDLDAKGLKNFFKDWQGLVGKQRCSTWEHLDFSQVRKHILETKSSPTIKDPADLDKYRVCKVDGEEQPVSNFIVEPPAIFKGRGDHPLRGKIKRRIFPEDVTLNLSKGAPVPKPNVPGEWGAVVHDRSAMWIASWRQNVTGKMHYVYLGQDSSTRMDKDKKKFELARSLKKRIKRIQKSIEEDLSSKDTRRRQLATAVWLIDHLAIRVGNEKGDDEAQTVGVTNLLLEHVHVSDRKLKLDFLGKDSVRYHRTIEIPTNVASNLHDYTVNKTRKDQLFDLIDSKGVNDYLQEMMPNLTAKVFRTMNSSDTFQSLLQKIIAKFKGAKMTDIFREYTMANVAVAELCNHQKMVVTGKTGADLAKLEERIKAAANNPARQKELKKLKRLRMAKKNLNLGTSRQNYIDPRITVAFAKAMGVPIEKFFSKNLLKKFKWALDVGADFCF